VSGSEIALARAAAAAARARLDATLSETRDRLRPANLADVAWDTAKDKAIEKAAEAVAAARARPAATATALGAIALFLARKPAVRAIARLAGGGDTKRRSSR
jgi:hypothetical protein